MWEICSCDHHSISCPTKVQLPNSKSSKIHPCPNRLHVILTSSKFGQGQLRCFNTVSRRPYPCLSVALKWFYPCMIARKFSPVIDYELKFFKMQFLVKSDFTIITTKKNLWDPFNPNFARSVDLLMKIRHQEFKLWCLANNLCEKWKILYVWTIKIYTNI